LKTKKKPAVSVPAARKPIQFPLGTKTVAPAPAVHEEDFVFAEVHVSPSRIARRHIFITRDKGARADRGGVGDDEQRPAAAHQALLALPAKEQRWAAERSGSTLCPHRGWRDRLYAEFHDLPYPASGPGFAGHDQAPWSALWRQRLSVLLIY